MVKKDVTAAASRTRELLSGAGLRSTAARMAVIRWLQSAKSPSTHAEIAADLVPMGFDKATVFRNLHDLAEAGLVTRTELGDHVWRFELRDSAHPDRGHHPHFVCIDCGTVTCLHDIDIPAASQKSLSKVGEVTEILMRGHCVGCS